MAAHSTRVRIVIDDDAFDRAIRRAQARVPTLIRMLDANGLDSVPLDERGSGEAQVWDGDQA